MEDEFRRWPTLCYVIQRNGDKVNACLVREDWRGLNELKVVWYDEVTKRWYRFHRTLGLVIPDPREKPVKEPPVDPRKEDQYSLF